MNDPRLLGSRQVIDKLFPGTTVVTSSMSEAKFRAEHSRHTFYDKHNFGTILDKDVVFLWQKTGAGSVLQHRVSRTPIGLSKRERSILQAFEKTQRGLFASDASRAAESTARMASYNAFGNILISRYLRGHDAANFWTPNLIVAELQGLSQRRYEGNACTSGVIFMSEPENVLRKVDLGIFQFEPSPVDHTFDVGFFDLPPSFRYVDGKNAFYVVDNWRKVQGILRLRSPRDFSLFDRATFNHLQKLFEVPTGRMFVASVGNHGDVTVQSRNGLQLRWQNLFWSSTDWKLLQEHLMSFGVRENIALALTSCTLAISDMRFGALILVADSPEARPSIAGSIGETGIASSLHRMMKGKRIADLMDSNEAIGILTSDGLTTLDKTGTILGAGEIIDLAVEKKTLGGGRTQAAISASKYGTAIKVSEDGPITVFSGGQEQIRFAR